MKDLEKRFRVREGGRVVLSRFETDDTAGFRSPEDAAPVLARNLKRLDALQYRLYAEGRRSLLIVLQGMDAAGKDGTVRHVMSGMNPQACRVSCFKKPTAEELAHDFLWRIHREVPRHGEVGIFNRSHYEDVLVVRVHQLVSKPVWKERYHRLNEFEENLRSSGTHILKFFLHLSRKEQTRRLKERLADPTKHWKLSEEDLSERKLWKDYQAAYEEMLEKCSTAHAPWYVIPADHKWFRDLAVAHIVADALEALDPRFPEPKLDVSKVKL